jgi:hypothetical protein
MRSCSAIGTGSFCRLKDEVQVLLHRQMRPQRQILEHEANAALVRWHEGAAWARQRSTGANVWIYHAESSSYHEVLCP